MCKLIWTCYVECMYVSARARARVCVFVCFVCVMSVWAYVCVHVGLWADECIQCHWYFRLFNLNLVKFVFVYVLYLALGLLHVICKIFVLTNIQSLLSFFSFLLYTCSYCASSSFLLFFPDLFPSHLPLIIGFPAHFRHLFIQLLKLCFQFRPGYFEMCECSFQFRLWSINFETLSFNFGFVTRFRQLQFKFVGHSSWARDNKINFVYWHSFSSKFHSNSSPRHTVRYNAVIIALIESFSHHIYMYVVLITFHIQGHNTWRIWMTK